MNKENDFYALRSALRRERQRNKELLTRLAAESERVRELEAMLGEREKSLCDVSARLDEREKSLCDANARLDESECEARRQIEELERTRRERDALDSEIAYIKGDGLKELISGNKEIKKMVISEYLAALPSGVALIGSTGYAALTPIHKPKDLADAKRIAEKIIK